MAFSSLYRGVAEQEFDLLQIPAVLPAELIGADPPQIMSGEVVKLKASGTVPNNVPDNVLRNTTAPGRSAATDVPPKYVLL
jgi:hypothetical protein